MIRYFLGLVIFIMASQCVFAIDRNTLNPEFFARFNDDCLVYYINSALENNHEAKQAFYRVEQYRQQVKSSFGKELPSFSVAANYLGIHVPVLDNFTLSKNAFVLPFMANYEADFLLKNRDKTKSTKKTYEASKLDEKSVYLALLTDVATVYTNILEYDELIKQQEKIINADYEILNANKRKYIRGTISSSELNNAEKDFETEKKELQDLQKERDSLLMQLAVLCGFSPNCNIQRGSLNTFEYQQDIPLNIESDVIFSRPDVLYAEKMLEKARIDIRVARKEFLPTFNITGLWAFNTIAPGSFFSWESSLAALLAGATQDIFKGGQKVANLRFQKAKYQELFEKYKQTDLEAVKEVNTTLCFIKHDTASENSANAKLFYETKNFKNSSREYTQGTLSKPEYYKAQSALSNQEKEAAQAKTQRLVNYFTLYKAVGGKL